MVSTDLFALSFPHLRTFCSCSSVQASRSTDFTLLICVPIPRCIPEHLQHRGQCPSSYALFFRLHTECTQRCLGSSSPILDLNEARCQHPCCTRLSGHWNKSMAYSRLFLLQSAQLLFPSSFSKVLIVCWFWAARSAAALGGTRLDIVFLNL